jgi:hypothetical protein
VAARAYWKGYPKLSLQHVPFIPAHAGIQSNKHWRSRPWIPAFAGMSGIDVDSIPTEHALALAGFLSGLAGTKPLQASGRMRLMGYEA